MSTAPSVRWAALRACLHTDTPHPQGEYVPHVTVGLYADALHTAAVAPRLDAFAPQPPLALHGRGTSA
jgi:hypothetical protein